MQLLLLAQATRVRWTQAYASPQVLARIIEGLDGIFAAYRANPRLAQEDPATPNPDWFGLGPSGQVIALLAESIKPRLDEQISDGAGARITRRAAYSEMLLATRDWHREDCKYLSGARAPGMEHGFTS